MVRKGRDKKNKHRMRPTERMKRRRKKAAESRTLDKKELLIIFI